MMNFVLLPTAALPQGGYSFRTYVGTGHFFGVQNFEFQYFWGFQKNKYFLGYEDFVDIFGGSS